MIDDDGDGVISQGDLNKMFCSLGKNINESQLQSMLQINSSEDKNGVTFPEFLSLMSETICELPEETGIFNCLKALSANDELQIPLEELMLNLREAGFQNPEQEFARLIKEFSVENQITNDKVFKGNQFLSTFSE